MVLALLPFEKAFYDKFNVPCEFVGHTLADEMPIAVDKPALKAHLGFDATRPLLALMPGSRSNEIKLLAADFFHTAQLQLAKQPNLQLVCNMVTEQKAEIYQAIKDEIAPDLPVTLLIGQARQTLQAADAVLIASGTATLEAMLAKTPMVVAYKTNWLTFQIAKRMVKVDHFSLPNLLAKRALVPELLQDAVTAQALDAALSPLFSEQGAQTQQTFTELHQAIRQDASAKAAAVIQRLLQ